VIKNPRFVFHTGSLCRINAMPRLGPKEALNFSESFHVDAG